MLLFEVADDIVPASAVERMRKVRIDGRVGSYTVSLHNGETFSGFVITRETVPNTSRLEAVRVWVNGDHEEHSIVPILAWRVSTPLYELDEIKGSSFPILAEPLASNEEVGILDPQTGVVTLLEDSWFESVEKFVAEVVKRQAQKAVSR